MTVLMINLLSFAALGRSAARAQDTSPSEVQIKAAFLFNFAKFVEWPPAAQTNSPFVIGVLGDATLASELERMVQDKQVNGRPLAIRELRDLPGARTCHILFISAAERGRWDEMVAGLRGASVLTVSDGSRFLQEGGMIHLYREQNKVRFEINDEAAREARLKISSKLLNLSRPPASGP